MMVSNLGFFFVVVVFCAISTRGTHRVACGSLLRQIYDSFYIKNPKCFSCLGCEISLPTNNNVKIKILHFELTKISF